MLYIGSQAYAMEAGDHFVETTAEAVGHFIENAGGEMNEWRQNRQRRLDQAVFDEQVRALQAIMNSTAYSDTERAIARLEIGTLLAERIRDQQAIINSPIYSDAEKAAAQAEIIRLGSSEEENIKKIRQLFDDAKSSGIDRPQILVILDEVGLYTL